MAWWWIMTHEILLGGEPSGRFRLCAKSDEDEGGPFGLCDCEDGHASREEAYNCPVARARAKEF